MKLEINIRYFFNILLICLINLILLGVVSYTMVPMSESNFIYAEQFGTVTIFMPALVTSLLATLADAINKKIEEESWK